MSEMAKKYHISELLLVRKAKQKSEILISSETFQTTMKTQVKPLEPHEFLLVAAETQHQYIPREGCQSRFSLHSC